MQPRDFARGGFTVLAAANVVFAIGGADRGPIYVVLQLASVIFALTGWFGTPVALATAFGGLGVVRVVTVALDLSRLPVWLNGGLALAAFGGAVAAGLGRGGEARFAAWVLAVGYFVAMAMSVAGSSAAATVGLLLATVAWSLVAPNLQVSGGSGSAS